MIRKENLRDVLATLGYQLQEESVAETWKMNFPQSNSSISIDFSKERINYPSELKAYRETTKNFSSPENFVVLECITRLLSLGYHPAHLELEKPMPGGHADTGGYCDILIKDNEGNEFALIECKTADDGSSKEFSKAWHRMIDDGGQLFNYFNSYRKAQALCLYASDWKDDKCVYFSHIVSMEDNDDYLRADKNLKGYKNIAEEKGGKDEYFKVWKTTYDLDYSTIGLFEEGIAPFTIGKRVLTIKDLREADSVEIQKKYHEYATIMRQHNVSGRENAFDKLVNLFLAKIVDEAQHPNDLQFYWRGAAHDDYYSLQDRLQQMYSRGMKEFLSEEVTYIDNKTISDSFYLFKNDPDATKQKILNYFQQLKFYTNNDFAFLDVHNQILFRQNAEILKKVVQMLQDMRLRTDKPNQFLGDFFEGFLDQGVKQSEGQFFTPMPIVRFIISSLPLEAINATEQPPKVIDYACGAGHFLNEYAEQIKEIVELKNEDINKYFSEIYGIEKEYRLSKVAKVSAFMYGQDDINIIYQDALQPNAQIKDGTYSVLVANPPYSVKGFLETLTEEQQANYNLSQYVSDISVNNSIEVFFIERAAQLLKPGGVAAIILPSSVLSNGGIYSRARKIILQQFNIVSIIEFSSGTFGKTGTNTITLFLRKKENTVPAFEHYLNRVQTWFNGDFTKDGLFEDAYLLDDYCQMQGIERELYTSLLRNTPDMSLWEHDLFKAYRAEYSNDTKAKQIGKKKITPKYTTQQRQEEVERYIVTATRAIEQDKLYYYLLAKSNPQPVLIVKSPTKTAETKQFLGYEWSTRKGDEGIKYIGAAETSDNGLSINKGIESIRTPLFNPANLGDKDYINSLVRSCFLGHPLPIAETLKDYCSTIPTEDMIDFKRADLDLGFSTVRKEILVFQSKYPMTTIGKFVPIIESGARPKGGVGHLKDGVLSLGGEHIDNNNGYLNLTSPKYVPQSFFDKATRGIVKKGDILLCKDGALTGKLALVRDELNGLDAMINEHVYILRCDNNVQQLYLFNFLSSEIGGALLQSKITGSAQRGLNSSNLKSTLIPSPSPSIQQQIVDECAKVDEEYENSRMAIEAYRAKISKIFTDLEVIINSNRGGYKYLIISDIGDILMCRRVFKDQTTPYGDIPFYKIGTFGGKPDAYISNTLYQEYKNKYPYPRKGEVLISAAGTIGKAVVYNGEDAYYQDSNIVWVRNDETKAKNSFLYYAYQNIKWKPTNGGTILRLYNKDLEATRIPVPPIDVQKEIVSEIEDYEASIAQAQAVMVDCATRKAEILKRYLL